MGAPRPMREAHDVVPGGSETLLPTRREGGNLAGGRRTRQPVASATYPIGVMRPGSQCSSTRVNRGISIGLSR